MNHLQTIKNVTVFFAYLLVVWGFYRLLFQIPDPFDEVIVKPLVWLVPVYLLLKKEKRDWRSVGIHGDKLLPAIYLSLLLGAVFTFEAIFINFLKYRGVSLNTQVTGGMFFGALILSAVTAISEEIAFRGYIFNRLWEVTDHVSKANLISSLAWSLVHLPIAIFDWHLGIGMLGLYLLLTFIFGFGAAYLFAKTKNIAAPIILHVLWAWPVILFR